MIEMTLGRIAEVVGGSVVHDAGTPVTGPAFVDTRSPEPGGLFVAVVGERVDGHDYAGAAVEAGAAAVLSTRDTGRPGVLVEDPVAALGLLARHLLSRLPDLRVVALTGSQGKTSTKDLLAQVLAEHGATVATRGSFNNELGLPLTVLRADASTELLVLEMGARHVGDLRASCEVARPDVALVLNVGKAHIGEFGSREAIATAKGELVEALDADGTAVLNADDPLVLAMAARTRGTVRTFGSADGADVRLDELEVDDLGRASFVLLAGRERATVHLSVVGEHHASNATAAAAVALSLGLSLDTVADALGAATATSRGRMEVHERADGVVVVDDAYNANPDSMRAALQALAALRRGRPGSRTVAVLGEMRELGASSPAEHEEVGRLAVQLGTDRLLVVGAGAEPLLRGAREAAGPGGGPVLVPDNEAATAWLREHLREGDVVLFKASNAVGLSTVAQQILTDQQTDPSEGSDG
jgi:UDP-N-acetylmuramoyl-tripeptide--D-alanyl-D-alanine ligase